MDATVLPSSLSPPNHPVRQGSHQDPPGKPVSFERSTFLEPALDQVNLSSSLESISAEKNTDKSKDQQGSGFSDAAAKKQNLSAPELQELRELKQRDAEVRTHEQAHYTAAGQYANGGASFSYELGPDGKRYAVEGEVPIDISREATPAKTLEKMQQIERAALAPQSPSAADRRIAARASIIAAEARRDISYSAAAPITENNPEEQSGEQTDSATRDAVSGAPKAQDRPSLSPAYHREMALKAYKAQAEI